ncbi:MAG TPA: class 1 fructose-bisphosphatase [Usitatibacter sp.]|nr:class 1 fructose-bisphosphatase [Usitatibacter sp.]
MPATRMTLTQFLIEERRRYPGATGELNGLILSVALACKSVATRVAQGALAGVLGASGEASSQDEPQQKLETIANEAFLSCADWGGHAAAMASEEMEAPCAAAQGESGKYLLVFDPLDGAPNIDVNLSVGSIFSILRVPSGAEDPAREGAFLQPGTAQVAAGYAIYGPSTMLVISVGRGVHAFTLERSIGEFLLTHPDLRVPERTSEFAINTSNSRFWEPPVRRYVSECLAGSAGPRGRDFNMRWIASLVAEAHRILVRGGVFLYPRDRKDPPQAGRLRLLYEANPVGFLIEQAGGRASTGRGAVLEVAPQALHQRIPFVFGSREEVERIERYHAEDTGDADLDLPLFQVRGLFRDPVGA